MRKLYIFYYIGIEKFFFLYTIKLEKIFLRPLEEKLYLNLEFQKKNIYIKLFI